VRIVEGYFADSLTAELAAEVGPVALAVLDADLYSSTLCALSWLTPLLSSGSLLLFDEYDGHGHSEKRAHEEWGRQTGIETELVTEHTRGPSGYARKGTDRRMLFKLS